MSDAVTRRGPAGSAGRGGRSGPRRTLHQVVWRLLPLTPFALVLAAWIAYWAIARPSAATLPAVQDVAAAMWELAVKGELAGTCWRACGASCWAWRSASPPA